jgi:hypothetical protein
MLMPQGEKTIPHLHRALRRAPLGQPRQHEADQHDGVLKSVETHLGDLPLPLPTD